MKVEVTDKEYGCEFHHVQIYVDKLKSLGYYQLISKQLNNLSHKGSFDPFSGGMRFLESSKALPERVAEGNRIWDDLCNTSGLETRDPKGYKSEDQDFVEQLIIGLGWRVTAQYTGKDTQSFLVTSQDARGVKYVITAKSDKGNGQEEDLYDHFSSSHIDRFYSANSNRMGIAVLGFQLESEDAINKVEQRYKTMHPKLFVGSYKYVDSRTITNSDGEKRAIILGSMHILEAFAYYKKDKNTGEADQGTLIRYVARSGTMGTKEGFSNPQGVLPGLEDVAVKFDGTSIPAYSDHWVSNVIDRNSFLDTLHDVIGFTPKVDFNAGVVAAGQARIESTVTGNTAPVDPKSDIKAILRDQSQVYLPINNALTSVGHVHLFIEEMGQGVQHLACRVKDLVSFIERVNNYRLMTGRGFSFLNIPQSYYGRLDASRDLMPLLNNDNVSANEVLNTLTNAGLCTSLGIVKLDITKDEIRQALSQILSIKEKLDSITSCVLRARYSNLYSLLKDHFNEETYLQIIRNKVLVDIQGNDVLFQIFTANILQRNAGEEAPFLEFIQRVCSQKKLANGEPAPIKPGCGGFGIRNFLTLFLSIEVSKAMHQAETSTCEKEASIAKQRVELFTQQLDESNPILTSISDAMTAEGDALDELSQLEKEKSTDTIRIANLEKIVKHQCALKLEGNKALQTLSDRYAKRMSEIA